LHQVGKLQSLLGQMLTMEIDFLDATKAERDEQKKRYCKVYEEMLKLGNLRPGQQEEFDQITKAVRDLTEECRAKEAELEPLRAANTEEYVSEMVELCDREAKTFSELTGKLRKLVRKVKLKRASTTFSGKSR
jgi:hypothetical protein